MTNDDKIRPEDIEGMKQAFKKAGMSDAEVSGAIADIWTMDEVAPINRDRLWTGICSRAE